MKGNLFVLQGGGPTAVINATLASIVRSGEGHFSNIFGLRHSFEHVCQEGLVNLSQFAKADKNAELSKTPGAILGSSRKKASPESLQLLLNLLIKQEAATLIGIGGNGTMTVLHQLHEAIFAANAKMAICGVPKTVDNDLPHTHVSPGFGSAARFVATAVRDFGYDASAMSTFDDVTILETMGRDCGWLALAANGLKTNPDDPPHIVLIPERPTTEAAILAEVSRQHTKRGSVFVVTNEVVRDANGVALGEAGQDGPKDELGRTMWSLSPGIGNHLANLVWKELGLQARCLRPGNLGRALSDCVSIPDRKLATSVGKFAVEQLLENKADGKMVILDKSLNPALTPLENINSISSIPDEFIGGGADRFSKAYQDYLQPLIGPVESLTPRLI